MESGIHTSGPYSKGERSPEIACSGTKSKEIGWRIKLDHCQWEDRDHTNVRLLTDGMKPFGLNPHATDAEMNQISCLYLNARSLIGKSDLFSTWVQHFVPDVIGITETWATVDIFDSELTLPGYDMFRHDRPVHRAGGGVILYVKSGFNAVVYELRVKFPEKVWCRIETYKNDSIHVDVCYRTPSEDIFGTGHHVTIRDLIDELGASKLHFILMGDFNHNFEHWPVVHSNDSPTPDARLFCDRLDDNFFSQHVDFPTRKRTILDLIITDELDMVSDLTDLGPLGSSDHQALLWKSVISAETSENQRTVYDYARADIQGIKQQLQRANWQEILSASSVEDNWFTFSSILRNLERDFIPLKRTRTRSQKPIWMTYKAFRAVDHKHKVYQKYKNSDHPACKEAN